MALVDELKAALGEDAVLAGGGVGERYRSDESRSGRTLPLAVLRPASVEAISLAMAICDRHGQSVVPQGGLTGLAGGANPGKGDIAISLERFSGVEEIDVAAATMTVRAGTPLETAQRAAEEAGFLLPIDLGSRGSCQIGGNIATNAGGIRVIRHGVTRDNVLGLEVVLADGAVLASLNKTMKNNTGYDLRQIFVGSEGTLGIITRAVLKLKPLPSRRSTALCATASYDKVISLLRMAKLMLANVSAFEVMWDSYFRFNAQALGLTFFDVDHLFLIIVEEDLFGSDLGGERFEAFLAAAFEEGLIDDALIAQSEKEARNFWSVREGYAMDKMLPSLVNLDVSMAIGHIGDYAAECGKALLTRFPGAHVSDRKSVV